jgi:hypothetical protein
MEKKVSTGPVFFFGAVASIERQWNVSQAIEQAVSHRTSKPTSTKSSEGGGLGATLEQ